MQVSIESCLAGAGSAKGLTVVFDVFRASNTIIACLAGGAEYIIPVGALEKAYLLKKKHPDHLLFGERKGLPPEGFDYGNSPAKAAQLDLLRKKIILTTSAGSQGIVHSTQAEEVLIGSFANAKAIVNYIKSKKPAVVSLLAIGNEAIEPAEEDEACAMYLKGLLEGTAVDLSQMQKAILQSNGANRLRRLQQEDDLAFCMELDTYGIVPKFNMNTGKITASSGL